MTDIEGVMDVTTFPQAEKSEFGREMLMNDIISVIRGIKYVRAAAAKDEISPDEIDVQKMRKILVGGGAIESN